MPGKLFAVISNTFIDILRQPVYGVVVAATIILLVLSPSLVMFTLGDDDLLLKDIGLSTLLVAGMLLGAFAATSEITEEIENKTALTVISKTVSRSMFILGKFIGIIAAVLVAEYLLSIVLLMVVRHGILEKAADKSDTVVITLGAVAATVTCLVGLAGNYFYRWRFTSTAILLGSLSITVSLVLLVFIDPKWQYNPAKNNMQWDLLSPLLLTVIAVLILTSVALACATRLNMTMTLIICVMVFVLGIMFEHWLGPIARSQSGLGSYLAWIPLIIVPSISYYVVTNAIYQGTAVPLDYISQVAIYAFFYVGACLLFAIALFRTREIG